MENYGYLEREELTSYDKYLLSKREKVVEAPSYSEQKINNHKKVSKEKDNFVNDDQNFEKIESRKFNEYDKYMFSELSRKTPSEERVMTQEEFYSSNVEKKSIASKFFTKMFNNVTFKKGGKFILILYVIIVVALASILIVANTTDIANYENANATSSSVQAEKSVVSSMTIEDKNNEESNWFDRLCDTINK